MPAASFRTPETNSFKDSPKLPEDCSQLWRIPLNKESDPSKLIVALRERIKELNCLFLCT